MFSLTSREQFLVAGIVVAAVVGCAVQHWRAERREVPVRIAAAGWSNVPPVPAHSGPAVGQP